MADPIVGLPGDASSVGAIGSAEGGGNATLGLPAPSGLAGVIAREMAASAPPVVPPASPPDPVVPPAPSAAELELQQLRSQMEGMPSREELEQLRQLAEVGYRSQLQQPVVSSQPASQSSVNPVTGVEVMTDDEMTWLQKDATGNVVAAPGAPAGLIEKYHRHTAGVQKFYREFARDPEKALGKLIEDRAQAVAQKLFEQTSEQRRHQDSAQRIQQELREWVYQKDPQGQVAKDFWGNPKLTAEGQQYMGFVEKLYAGGQGIKDPDELHRAAQLMLVGHLYQVRQGQAPAQVPPPPVNPDDARKQDLLSRAAAAAQIPMNGSMPVPGPPSKPRSLRDVINETALQLGQRV